MERIANTPREGLSHPSGSVVDQVKTSRGAPSSIRYALARLPNNASLPRRRWQAHILRCNASVGTRRHDGGSRRVVACALHADTRLMRCSTVTALSENLAKVASSRAFSRKGNLPLQGDLRKRRSRRVHLLESTSVLCFVPTLVSASSVIAVPIASDECCKGRLSTEHESAL